MLGNGLVFSQTTMSKLLASIVCGQGLTQKYICEKMLLFLVTGSDPYLFDTVIIVFYELTMSFDLQKYMITVTLVVLTYNIILYFVILP